jgi:hypothetical protein
MLKEDYKRIGFKEILDIFDPDLTNDFKQTSYYHNEYKKKYSKRKNLANQECNNLINDCQIKINEQQPFQMANPSLDLDNYM